VGLIMRMSSDFLRKHPLDGITLGAAGKAQMLAITKLVLACLLVAGMLASSACLGPSAQSTSNDPAPPAQGSFGYRFVPEQQVVRGLDDEPTSPAGADSESASLVPAGSNGMGEPTPESPASISGEDRIIGLVEDPEERLPIATPQPYPPEWLTEPPQRGFFDSPAKVFIMGILLVIAIIAGVGAVRQW
jgi:hypothetical protein